MIAEVVHTVEELHRVMRHDFQILVAFVTVCTVVVIITCGFRR